MFQNKYVPLIGQYLHFHDWWRNSYTYGPGPALVLRNEALEPLEREKPRRLPIIKTFPGEPIKNYFLIRFRERETRGGI